MGLTQSDAVLGALDPDYVGPDCCIKCRQPVTMWAAAAVSPKGRTNGYCSSCHRLAQSFGRHPTGVDAMLAKIRNGDYD